MNKQFCVYRKGKLTFVDIEDLTDKEIEQESIHIGIELEDNDNQERVLYLLDKNEMLHKEWLKRKEEKNV